jgi:hypothetical protein
MKFHQFLKKKEEGYNGFKTKQSMSPLIKYHQEDLIKWDLDHQLNGQQLESST